METSSAEFEGKVNNRTAKALSVVFTDLAKQGYVLKASNGGEINSTYVFEK